MLFYPAEKLALFIDGANLYGSGQGAAVRHRLQAGCWNCSPARARWCAPSIIPRWPRTRNSRPLRPLVDWLDYNGFSVVTKPLKEFTDSQGRRRVKGNMDIELAIDVMEMAGCVDHVVIFSGDGDFRRLVEAVQRKGRRVSVVSTIRTSPPMVADELRRQADNFIELDELKSQIARDAGAKATCRSSCRPRPHASTGSA